ncbi:hypothetical protein RQP46_000426 [Phenoliferia psychrophenolica]
MSAEVLPASLSGFHPTQNEKEATQFLFNKADTEGLGVLTGDTAVPFFNHSGLPLPILGEIWQISDPDNSGFLTPERFGAACRLIGHAQAEGASAEVKPDWLATQGPLPRFDGFAVPAHLLPPQGIAPPRSPIQPQGTGSSATSGNAGNTITPDEKIKYAKLFAAAHPVNGLIDGDTARTIFIKSKLPFDTLGKIWNLADTHSRGSLDVADFTVGMHLIQHTMNGALPSLPAVLNPSLYASALPRLGGPPLSTPASPSPASRHAQQPTSPLRQSSMAPPPIPAQNTGSYIAPSASYSAFRAPAPVQAPVVAWDITPAEKADADRFFDGIDTARTGTIEGEAAVGFFSQSGLPIEQLAKVWDLADIRESGALNKDEFAVALKLIRDNLAGKELPQVLPVSLTPPSLRRAPAAAPAPQRDLLDLDDDEEPTLSPQVTGQQQYPSTLSPQGTGQYQTAGVFSQTSAARPNPPMSASSSYSGLQGTIFPQATGASQQALSPQGTGSFKPAVQAREVAPSGNFFDDNDDADQSAKLSADGAKLGNLQNEHASTQAAVGQLAATRGELEQSLSATTSAINELQVKLSQARAAHETERTMVEDLQSRHKDQATLLARQRTELITAESDLSALRVERTEIEGNYLRDKEDVRDMKKKMAEVAAETARLRDELERLKKEARQQKGLVAISKKQLSTAEAEKDKVAAAVVEAEREAALPRTVEHEDDEDSPFDHSSGPVAAAVPLPMSPAMVSPTSSVRSMNPFDRLGAISTVTSPIGGSPETTRAATPASPPPAAASTTHPVAVAAAVGAGAVAAVSALGATVAGVFGSGEKKDEPEHHSDATTPVASPHSEPEKDPFGLPVANNNAAFESSFDDGFGDDFSAAPPAAALAASSSIPAAASFDDAFGELDEPAPAHSVSDVTEVPAVEAVEEAAPEDSEPAFHTPSASHAEGLDDEAALPTSEATISNPETISTAPIEHVKEIEPEEPESSDDEDEIEDAAPAGHHGLRDLSASESASPHVGTTASDSGESFVHVVGPGEAEQDKSPALATLAEPSALSTPLAATSSLGRSASPASEQDTFEDADSSPTTTMFDSSAAAPKKRPAPPPPARSTASPPVAAANSAFDDAFGGDDFGSSSVISPAASTSKAASPVDDFDSAFADLPPPAPVTRSAISSSSGAGAAPEDFDNFDTDFDFKPSFDDPPTSTKDFDDSFGTFDATFAPAASVRSTVSPSTSGPITDEPFSFSSAFDNSPGPDLALSSPGLPIPAAAPPAPSPALTDDVDGIKQIVAMGFSRSQAISALEKYNYDVQRSINSMLG